MSRLFYGDNLDVLREHVGDESVDLIYLDPPFNSNANYNVLFKSPKGVAADSQIEAFEDSWHYGPEAARAFHEVITGGNTDLANLLRAMREFLGQNDMMAYLAMMAVRLIELHRVLKPTGSFYLHCDPTASHYLKLLLDALFGAANYRNEITWKRTTAHSDGARYGRNTDILLFYTKSDSYTWNPQFVPYEADYAERFRNVDPDGRRWMDDNLTAKGLSGGGYDYEYRGVRSLWRMPPETMERLDREGRLHFTRSGGIRLKRYLDEAKGTPVQALWSDIPAINSQAQERLGYPTQKPIALLERVIAASSNPGELVLDPFCGCGTAVHAAQRLGRRWIGIDITYLAVGLIGRRMHDAFPGIQYEVVGEPKGLMDAEHLAATEPHQFQYWITQKIGGRPYRGGRKGADRGIDGYIFYTRGAAVAGKSSTAAAIISVKAGRTVGVAMVRDLKGVMEREKADIGIFICVANPSREMEREAAAAGIWTDPATGQDYPRLQLLTLAELFQGRLPRLPLLDRQAGYRRAGREEISEQARLL